MAQDRRRAPIRRPVPARRKGAAVVLLTLTFAMLAPVAARAATASILTEFKDSVTGRTTTKSTPFGFYAPVSIDVDNNTATGGSIFLAGADLQVQVQPVGLGIGLHVNVDRTETARPLPLRFTIVYPYTSTSVFDFGYDARSSTSPTSMALQFVTGGLLAPSVDASMTQSGAGSSLALFGDIYDEAPDGSHGSPKTASLTLSPVPGTFSASLGGAVLSSGAGHIGFASQSPTLMRLSGTSLDGVYTERYGLTVDKLPTSLSLDATTDGTTGENVLTYSASDVVGRIDLSYSKRIPARVTESFTGAILSMPTSVTMRSARAGSLHVTTNAPIGQLTFGTASSTDPDKAGVPSYKSLADYAYSAIDGGFQSFAFQIHGLNELQVGNVATGFTAILDANRVPFHAIFWQNNVRNITIDVLNLPGRMQINSDLKTQFSYTAANPVDEIDVQANVPGGLSGKYTYLRTKLQQIPASLSVSFGGANGAVSIDTGGPAIGYLELVFSTGQEYFPWDVWATSDANVGQQPQYQVDGVLLWDTPGLPPMMSARIHGLSRATASLQAGTTNVSLRTGGLPRFAAEVWAPTSYVFADLQGLAPSVDVAMAPYGGGQQITYNASSEQRMLRVNTGSYDGATWTWATLQNPLPKALDIRTNVDLHNKVYFDAPIHTNLDMASSSGSSVTGGWVQHLRVGSDGGGSDGWIELDTQNTVLKGDYQSGSTRLDIRPPDGYVTADNRRVRWSSYIPVESSGSATCVNTYATVGGSTINIGWLC